MRGMGCKKYMALNIDLYSVIFAIFYRIIIYRKEGAGKPEQRSHILSMQFRRPHSLPHTTYLFWITSIIVKDIRPVT